MPHLNPWQIMPVPPPMSAEQASFGDPCRTGQIAEAVAGKPRREHGLPFLAFGQHNRHAGAHGACAFARDDRGMADLDTRHVRDGVEWSRYAVERHAESSGPWPCGRRLLPAALYTAVAKTLFRANVNATASLDDVLVRMNVELARDNDQAVFVTALVGCLSLATGEVSLADAGHNPALIRRRAGRLEKAAVPKCLPLGVLDDADYSHGRLTLAAGETLVLYTDGVTDARAPAGEQFGSERLDEVVARAGSGAAEVVRAITEATTRFASGAPPEDDLTLLIVRYVGA